MSLRTRGALLAPALLLVAACSADPSTGPAAGARGAVVATALKNDRLATVEWEGRFPRLYLQNADGSARTRVRLENVHDKIDGNLPAWLLPVTDETVIAMSNPVWSPDGQQLALVVSAAFDQSEVLVMNADGRQLRVESVNGQNIMGRVDWSPDSRRIAYVMSTAPRGRQVDLFVTDLVTDKVARLTRDGRFGAFDQYRWEPSGTGIWFTQFQEYAEDGWNRIVRVYRAGLDGAITGVPGTLAGDLQAIARDGRWALSVRYTRDGAQELVRLPIGKGEEQVLERGEFRWAQLLEGDREAIVARYAPPRGVADYGIVDPLTGVEHGTLKVDGTTSSMGLMRAGR